MLSLIEFEERHFGEMLPWFPDEASLIQWAGPDLTFPLTQAKLAHMLAQSLADPPERLCWMAVADGSIAGHAQLVLDRENGKGRIARLVIAPSHRGKGLAPKLVSIVADRAFEFDWIDQLELNVFTFNDPAMRAYARAGFVPDDTRRSSTFVDGERWEMVLMHLPRSEWKARH